MLCLDIILLIITIFYTNHFSKEYIHITLKDPNGITSKIRWDNLTSQYPFIGEDVFQEIHINANQGTQVLKLTVPHGRSNKLRLDFESSDIKNSYVILQKMQIITPYKNCIFSPENIIDSFNGVNGAILQLENNGVKILFEQDTNQFIESMNLRYSTSYYQAIFSWFLRFLYILLFSYFVIIKSEIFKFRYHICNFFKKCIRFYPYIFTLLYSILIIFSIELVTRKSIYQTYYFIKNRPIIFIFNILLVLGVLLLGLLIKHYYLAIFLLSIPFWCFSIASYLVYSMRGTLILYQDITALQYGLAILKDSFNNRELLISGICAVTLIFLLIIVYFLYHIKSNVHIIKPIVFIIFLANLICVQYISHQDIWNTNAWDQKSQLDNGCLGTLYYSFINRKTEKPDEYSSQKIQQIKENLIPQSTTQEDCPNIIFLQIEAFMDPTVIEGLTFSSDPIPNFRKLQERFGSSNLTVPVFGGATVNTEFEILTGLPVKWLQQGGYPYLTIATYKPVESLAYYFRDTYQTTAIHNWYGDFYNRDIVFQNLGFEEYISRETMTEQIYNDYYMSDEMFEKYIPLILEDSEEKDFIYGITVGMHGPYASDNVVPDEITVSGTYNETDLQNVQKYVNELYKSDKVLGKIIEYLDTFHEPVVFILYGDHQPALSLLDSSKADSHIVPYIIYNNYNEIISSQDLYSYQLSSYILDELHLSGGYITDFHQAYSDMNIYQDDLKLLQYDILNGKQYIYDESSLYIPETMHLGHDIVSITNIEKTDAGLLIYGYNFNSDSEIYINGKQENTVYLDSNTLKCNSQVSGSCTISVKQKGLYRSIGNEAVFEYIQN